VAVSKDGTLWAWGCNRDGQLGDGTAIGRTRPVEIGSGWAFACAGDDCTFGVKRDGTLWSWGSNEDGRLGNGEAGTKALRPFRIVLKEFG